MKLHITDDLGRKLVILVEHCEELEAIAKAMNAYPDSDLVSLAITLKDRDEYCTKVQAENKKLRDLLYKNQSYPISTDNGIIYACISCGELFDEDGICSPDCEVTKILGRK